MIGLQYPPQQGTCHLGLLGAELPFRSLLNGHLFAFAHLIVNSLVLGFHSKKIRFLSLRSMQLIHRSCNLIPYFYKFSIQGHKDFWQKFPGKLRKARQPCIQSLWNSFPLHPSKVIGHSAGCCLQSLAGRLQSAQLTGSPEGPTHWLCFREVRQPVILILRKLGGPLSASSLWVMLKMQGT